MIIFIYLHLGNKEINLEFTKVLIITLQNVARVYYK